MTSTATVHDTEHTKGANSAAAWFALWTNSHCEQLVHDQLLQRGFHAFLPTIDLWSRRRGVRRLVRVPMFAGYLFVRHAMDRESHVEMRKVRGLVRVLGERWDRLAAIPDDEMKAVEHVATSGQPVLPFPYLQEGQRVRITTGPLNGVQGFFVGANAQRGTLVVSVHLLQRSVSIVVDATDVAPAA